jgi:pimeloyl-ACP methyl ester carboxylesterase
MPNLMVGDIRYAYIEAGTGPLLIFAHGTFGAKESFLPLMTQLSSGYRCVSIDLPGHGDSSYNPDGWSIDDLVRAVPALILALGEQQAVLVGVSQGGAIFMRTALAYPDMVAALVIMCAGATTPPAPLMENLRQFAGLLRDELDESTRERSARAFLSSFHAPALVEARDPGIEAEVGQVLRHDRRAMPLVAELPASYRPILDQLPQITCPTLVVWGGQDFRPSLGADISAQIPHSQLRVIESAGHHVHVDASDEVAEVIGEFLAIV